jgi:CRP-like cAMP-binding protein
MRNAPFHSSQEERQERRIRPRHFPGHHRRGQEDPVGCEKASDIRTGRRGGRYLLVQKGRVRLTVVSKIGKEATIAIVSDGNFFGEGSLAGQFLRMGSAAAMTDCEILRVEKKTMMDVLHREPALSEMFVAYLLGRNPLEDLVDQLFNSSEKRLARVLLLLAHFGKEGIHYAGGSEGALQVHSSLLNVVLHD